MSYIIKLPLFTLHTPDNKQLYLRNNNDNLFLPLFTSLETVLSYCNRTNTFIPVIQFGKAKLLEHIEICSDCNIAIDPIDNITEILTFKRNDFIAALSVQ